MIQSTDRNKDAKLTTEQQVRYVAVFLGDRCPHCEKAESVETLSSLRLTANWEASLELWCISCGARWRDIYRLHAVEDIEDDDPNELDDESAGHIGEEG